MGCRDGCCGGAGVASWTYAERFEGTRITLAAGQSESLDIVDIFTMRGRSSVDVLPSRGCKGTCGGARFLDVVVQGYVITCVQVFLSEGMDETVIGTLTSCSDYRLVQPGSSEAECQVQSWRFRLTGPKVQLTIFNAAAGALAELDLFAVFRNA